MRVLPDNKRAPLVPVPAPFSETSRIITTAEFGTAAATSFTVMAPGEPADRMPARVPVPLIVIDLVMVTTPKPPGSRTEISPLSAVLEMAPAKVLHGAVRLHGFASSPTPETQVRVACAWAKVEKPQMRSAIAKNRVG